MKKIQLFKYTDLLTDKSYEADHFLDRFKGLIGIKQLSEGGGLLIPRCNSVHMWGMSIKIDILFLKRIKDRPGRHYKIISMTSGVKPWRWFPLWNLNSTDVFEACDGFILKKGLKVGDEINVSIEGDLSTKK